MFDLVKYVNHYAESLYYTSCPCERLFGACRCSILPQSCILMLYLTKPLLSSRLCSLMYYSTFQNVSNSLLQRNKYVLALLQLLFGQLCWFWKLRSHEEVRLTLGSFRTKLKHSSKCELLKISVPRSSTLNEKKLKYIKLSVSSMTFHQSYDAISYRTHITC